MKTSSLERGTVRQMGHSSSWRSARGTHSYSLGRSPGRSCCAPFLVLFHSAGGPRTPGEAMAKLVWKILLRAHGPQLRGERPVRHLPLFTFTYPLNKVLRARAGRGRRTGTLFLAGVENQLTPARTPPCHTPPHPITPARCSSSAGTQASCGPTHPHHAECSSAGTHHTRLDQARLPPTIVPAGQDSTRGSDQRPYVVGLSGRSAAGTMSRTFW